jgi:hypothetical protein
MIARRAVENVRTFTEKLVTLILTRYPGTRCLQIRKNARGSGFLLLPVLHHLLISEIDLQQKRETCRQAVQEVGLPLCRFAFSLLTFLCNGSQALFPQIYTDLFAIYQRKHFYRDAEFTQKLYGMKACPSAPMFFYSDPLPFARCSFASDHQPRAGGE